MSLLLGVDIKRVIYDESSAQIADGLKYLYKLYLELT